ncbi:NUDIX hydrolase [Arenivirga flava]|uniref:ADP-ribose pyrophosphatase n=1 Tax=Arenivirga flava TaxID=1930060 RepID=A0AA37XAT3_9MICO|nr:NUDIX domain-containing protein [Arenivirga flava]GMA27032.1 ADP-ribose pyrophosphatase [Arenivirga flava]
MDEHPSLAVSTVIFALRDSELWTPLVRRIRQPYQDRWALPGGWVAPQEGLETTAARKLLETTQLDPTYLEQLYCFGDIGRSPSGRVVSVVYWALVRPDQAERSSDDDNVRWFRADALPGLAFDHNRIVEYALWRLRNKMAHSSIAHGFLGETFTLAELRGVHEAVRGATLDPANFRRQVLAGGSIVPTGEHVVGASHRPPALYRYTDATLVDQGPLLASALTDRED